jgi:hypothetical protein
VVYLPTRFGFDKRRTHLSDLILFDQISRDEAIEALKAPPIPAEELHQLELYVQKKLGLTPEAYRELLNTPARDHKEFPTDATIMKLYARLKQKKASPAI